MQTRDVLNDFETTVNDLKAVVVMPIDRKDAFLAHMHQDAQAAAFIRCVGVVQHILRDIISAHKKTDAGMMSPEQMTEYLKSELNLIDESNAEVLNFLQDLAVFLGMCNRAVAEDKREFDEAMAHMPDICDTLTHMVEDFKGEV